MARFSDLLKAPLPSAGGSYTRESDNEPDLGNVTPKSKLGMPGDPSKDPAAAKNNFKKVAEDGEECFGGMCPDDEDEGNSNVAPENKAIEDEVDPTDPTDAVISDDINADDDSVNQKIDDTIQRTATEVLLNGELSGDEADGFIESVDCDAALAESFITERTIVRFDKKARWAQLHKVAVLAIAKEKHDPLYKKLVTAWRIEKTIEGRLTDKYGAQANPRVRMYIQKAKQSKSGAIKKAASKISK